MVRVRRGLLELDHLPSTQKALRVTPYKIPQPWRFGPKLVARTEAKGYRERSLDKNFWNVNVNREVHLAGGLYGVALRKLGDSTHAMDWTRDIRKQTCSTVGN